MFPPGCKFHIVASTKKIQYFLKYNFNKPLGYKELFFLIQSHYQKNKLANLSINRIEVRQHLGGKISIGMSTKVKLTQLKPNDELYHRLSNLPRDHECSTPKRDVEEWLQDEHDSIDRALTNCVNTISDSITKMLMEVLHGESWQV